MIKLVFATNNIHKLEEIREILGKEYTIVSLKEIGCDEDIPEEQETLEGNALQKARYVKEKYGYDCFADDTGMEVMALNGRPGVYSARYAGDAKDSDANMEKILSELEGIEERSAKFRTIIVLISGNNEYLFEGIVEGDILKFKAGTFGFGYDPIFRPSGYTVSFAEMSMAEKNKISHRGAAVKKLAQFLKEQAE